MHAFLYNVYHLRIPPGFGDGDYGRARQEPVLKALKRHGCIGRLTLAIVEDESRVSYTWALLARLGGGGSLRRRCGGGCHRSYLEQAVGKLD